MPDSNDKPVLQNKSEDQGLLNQFFERQDYHLFLIVVLSCLILFTTLHVGDLSGYDDAFYAHEGKEMLRTGDWWNIRFNGGLNFEYPPMFIWMEALSMKLFGVTDFAAKFPSALCGLLIIVLVFLITRRLTEDFWLPILAAWVMLFTQYFLKYSMHAMTDVPFTMFFTVAIFLYIKGLQRPLFLALCGIPIGLAILTRSLLGTIVIAIILTHILLTRQFRLLLSVYFLCGLLIALLLPSIWFYSQYRLYGNDFLVAHLSFFSGKLLPPKSPDIWKIIRNLLHYPRMLFKLYLPWFPLMIFGLFLQVKAMVRTKDKLATLLVLWVVLVLFTFSMAEAKILRYIMPAFPAFSILSATAVTKWLSTTRKRINLKVVYCFLIIAALSIAIFANHRMRAEDMRQLAPLADAHTTPDQPVFIYTYGQPHSNYVAQLLWYSNRFCENSLDANELFVKINNSGASVVIMDKETYANFVTDPNEPAIRLKRKKHELVLQVKPLGESEKFICFQATPASNTAQNDTR
jgi:4-amino-4-deoxy-L-arabinose transferase-like glycosyltransferase